MIPNTIHYCWFGNNPKPDIIKKCIASWHRYCPGWEIFEWNENNWDVTRFRYAQEAYEAKKWAFVSDVARLDILYRFGGVYLDTDVEILKENPFGEYLNNNIVMCFENGRSIASGLFFATEKGNNICKRFISSYTCTHYSKKSQLVNTKMNEPIIREMLPNLKWNGKTQLFELEDIKILIVGCEEYSQKMKHHGTRSWCDNLPEYTVSRNNRLKKWLRKPEYFEKLESCNIGKRLLPLYTFVSYDLFDLGPIFYLKLFYNNHIKAYFKSGK